MSKHTPGLLDWNGKWRICAGVRPGERIKVICDTANNNATRTEENNANARRLVAAWNACEGISTEALESGAIRQLLAACKAFDAYWRECARVWHDNEGGVAKTENGAVVVGKHLDELAERAASLVIDAIALAEGPAKEGRG